MEEMSDLASDLAFEVFQVNQAMHELWMKYNPLIFEFWEKDDLPAAHEIMRQQGKERQILQDRLLGLQKICAHPKGWVSPDKRSRTCTLCGFREFGCKKCGSFGSC